MGPILPLLVFSGLVFFASAGTDGKNYFTSPATNTGVNPVYTIGDTLLVSWVTELEEFNVTIWQESLVQESAASKGNIFSKIHASDQITNFTWAVQLYGFDLSYSNEFFLWVDPDSSGGFTSTYFNITEPKSTTTATQSVVSSTATATGRNAASPHASSSVSSESTSASSSPSSDTSLSTSSKIGLGVGVGLGVPILCALGVLIWLKIRQPKNNDNTTVAEISNRQFPAHSVLQPTGFYGHQQPNAHYELSSTPSDFK